MQGTEQKTTFRGFFSFYVLLSVVGGFLEAYAYATRGFFCNAQTGNVAMMVYLLFTGETARGFSYLLPIGAYILAIALTAVMPKQKKKLFGFVTWSLLCAFIEVIVLFLVGFIPLDMELSHAALFITPLAFVTGLQFNTFKGDNGMTFATILCTKNLCFGTVNFVEGVRERNKDKLMKGTGYFFHIACFIFGAILAVLLWRFTSLQEKTVWVACGVMSLVFLWLFVRDIRAMQREKVGRNAVSDQNYSTDEEKRE